MTVGKPFEFSSKRDQSGLSSSICLETVYIRTQVLQISFTRLKFSKIVIAAYKFDPNTSMNLAQAEITTPDFLLLFLFGSPRWQMELLEATDTVSFAGISYDIVGRYRVDLPANTLTY